MQKPPQQHRIARRTALGMLAGWSVGMAGPASAAPSSEARQARALQRSDLVDAQDRPHRLAELTRPLLLINLWASWCPECLGELPSLRALAARLGPDAIDIVMLSHGMNWAGDVAYARRTEIPFRHWRLPPHAPEAIVAAAFRIEDDRFGLPQSLVLAGPERALVDSNVGGRDWSAPKQMRLLRSWLSTAG
jgi:thiol-disulfide isomerase/thioredoxin